MWGTLVVGNPVQEAATGEDVIRNPTEVPPPLAADISTEEVLHIEMETVEVTGQLADGTTYSYFTFGGKVPGPMIRMRIGQTAEVVIRNNPNSTLPHSIDLHAVTGPGGGAVFTQTNPGDETSFTFRALNPGLYVYHCATPSVAHHIASGLYGLIPLSRRRPAAGFDRNSTSCRARSTQQAASGSADTRASAMKTCSPSRQNTWSSTARRVL
jgi:nitrite reductase (NO-forming)